MTRILLDTTYLLPAAGISVQGVAADVLRRVRAEGHEVVISEISLFELLAKGAKLAAEGRADQERIYLAARSILQDKGVERIAAYGDAVVKRSISLRRYHHDFVDCMILASALEACEALMTEDETLSRSKGVQDIIKETRPGFVISGWKNLMRK